MSEFNDFQRRPDQGAFDSCFSAIATCDYYVLMVGGEKGSPYQGDVSVTQQEFRVATQLAQHARIRPIVLVRAEVFNALRERESIARGGADPEVVQTAESTILRDPDFVATFLAEIRETEVQGHVPNEPKELMWHYRFTSFEDIVQVLTVNLALHRPIAQQVLMANVRHEVEQNLAAMSTPQTSDDLPIFFRHRELSPVRYEIELPRNLEGVLVTLNAEQATKLAGFLLTGIPNPDMFRTAELERALSSGEFLSYDAETQEFKDTPIVGVLQKLVLTVDRFRRVYKDTFNLRSDLFVQIKPSRDRILSSQEVSNNSLAFVYALHDILENILQLSTALLRYIYDTSLDLELPSLLPLSPFDDDEAQKVENEIPTAEDISNWVQQGAH